MLLSGDTNAIVILMEKTKNQRGSKSSLAKRLFFFFALGSMIILFYFFFDAFIYLFFTLQYCIGFSIHQHASATGVHISPS